MVKQMCGEGGRSEAVMSIAGINPVSPVNPLPPTHYLGTSARRPQRRGNRTNGLIFA